jgi:hypothetical protein
MLASCTFSYRRSLCYHDACSDQVMRAPHLENQSPGIQTCAYFNYFVDRFKLRIHSLLIGINRRGWSRRQCGAKTTHQVAVFNKAMKIESTEAHKADADKYPKVISPTWWRSRRWGLHYPADRFLRCCGGGSLALRQLAVASNFLCVMASTLTISICSRPTVHPQR